METKKHKPATRIELAKRYGVSLETLKKWLSKIPELDIQVNARVLTPKQVSVIIEHLGEPFED
ncbi:transposase [Runella defluvii]|uniref:Transposase n=1 Tax=Runella defluvii TaxID=370973 RepID=A0A7W5ZHG4_9BACT|nr:hypothetical protein [Runella defluvii]MBB3836994.1 transposase [Runella defluvii]